MKTGMMAVVVGGLLLIGCGKEAPPEPAKPATLETTAEIESRLAAADRADGTEDRIISQCLSCGLAMEGSEDHATDAAGYTIHFCSESCLEHFEEDPRSMVMALSLEEEPG